MCSTHQIPSPTYSTQPSPTYSPASPTYEYPITFMDEMEENDNDEILITFCKIAGSKEFPITIEDSVDENNEERTDEDEQIIVNPFQNLLEEIKRLKESLCEFGDDELLGSEENPIVIG